MKYVTIKTVCMNCNFERKVEISEIKRKNNFTCPLCHSKMKVFQEKIEKS